MAFSLDPSWWARGSTTTRNLGSSCSLRQPIASQTSPRSAPASHTQAIMSDLGPHPAPSVTVGMLCHPSLAGTLLLLQHYMRTRVFYNILCHLPPSLCLYCPCSLGGGGPTPESLFLFIIRGSAQASFSRNPTLCVLVVPRTPQQGRPCEGLWACRGLCSLMGPVYTRADIQLEVVPRRCGASQCRQVQLQRRGGTVVP